MNRIRALVSTLITIGATVVVLFLWKKLLGGMDMIDMYVQLVEAGRRTCDVTNKRVRRVPKKYRAEVIEDLKAMGLGLNGEILKADEEDEEVA